MRVAALTVLLSVVLTSCGLAARSTPALAPEVATGPLRAVTAPKAEPAQGQAVIPAVVAPEPAVAPKATLSAAAVGPMKHVWQTLNNCGPAAVVMALSTLGVDVDQETARLALRGPDERRGMSPAPVSPWVKDKFGLRAVWRNNGTNARIKALVTNGFAPMVTQWMVDPEIERISHWRTVQAYDDKLGAFYVNDPMRGRGVPLTYEWFDRSWQPFSYRYLVIYRPEDEPLLRAIVGEEWNDREMRRKFYERARFEAHTRGTSASWLALGEAAYGYGMFDEAVRAFEQGLALGSGQGVFTLRSSYPAALRALGRTQEAAAVQQRMSLTPLPPTVAPVPDALALQLARERLPERIRRIE